MVAVEDGSLTIVWAERNGPRVDTPSHRGFGTRVIEQIIQGDLNGRAAFDWRAEGLVCELALDPGAEA
jgi:two-component sensor histidine kinase